MDIKDAQLLKAKIENEIGDFAKAKVAELEKQTGLKVDGFGMQLYPLVQESGARTHQVNIQSTIVF